jgi:hypothetical protein
MVGLLAGPGGVAGASSSLSFGGHPVVNLQAVLTAADASFQAAASAGKATVVPGSECYLTEAGSAVTGGWCGPVAYPDDPVGDDWQTLALASSPVPGGVDLTGTPGTHGQAPPVGVRLVRPGEPTRLVPAPSIPADAQVLPPGQLAVLSSPGVPLAPVADGRLRVEDTSLTIQGIARSTVAGVDGSGVNTGPNVVTAGPGQMLVVCSFSMSQGNPPLGVNETDEVGVSVIADGVSLPVNSGSVAGAAGEGLTVAVSVTRTGGSALLELQQGQLTQKFDLLAGQRVAPAPAVLYLDAAKPYVTLTGGQASTQVSSGGETAPVTIQLQAASLQELAPDGSVPPSADDAWLVVELDAPDNNNAPDGTVLEFYLPAAPFVHALLPDGTSVAAVDNEPGNGNDVGFLPQYVWMAVPAAAPDIKLVVGGATTIGGNPGTLADATFNLPIPAGAPGSASTTPVGPTLVAALTAELPEVPSAAPRATAGGTSSSGGGGRGGGVALVAGLLLLVGLGVVVPTVVAVRARRRRRTPPPAPEPGPNLWKGLIQPTVFPASAVDDATEPAPAPVAVMERPPIPALDLAATDVGGRFAEELPERYVLILGTVQVAGGDDARAERTAQTNGIGGLLAGYRDGRTMGELRSREWRGDDGADVTENSVIEMMSRFRAFIGGDVFPSGRGGYRLKPELYVDWWRTEDDLGEGDRRVRAGDAGGRSSPTGGPSPGSAARPTTRSTRKGSCRACSTTTSPGRSTSPSSKRPTAWPASPSTSGTRRWRAGPPCRAGPSTRMKRTSTTTGSKRRSWPKTERSSSAPMPTPATCSRRTAGCSTRTGGYATPGEPRTGRRRPRQLAEASPGSRSGWMTASKAIRQAACRGGMSAASKICPLTANGDCPGCGRLITRRGHAVLPTSARRRPVSALA